MISGWGLCQREPLSPEQLPGKFGGNGSIALGASPEVFAQKTGFGTKTGFDTFYSLVSSSPQADSIRMVSLQEGAPTPMTAPLTIWWR